MTTNSSFASAPTQFSFDFSMERALEKIENIDPVRYASTRNFHNGSITKLSPFISRGMISTVQIVESLRDRGFSFEDCEKLISELAWRDYWQSQWNLLGDGIDQDIKHAPLRMTHREISSSIVFGQTGIKEIDASIRELMETGYVHNHMRMYIASLACHFGGAHWHNPAQWMYFYLIDGDWASNALSWQWVAGSSRNKTYFFNQENLNKYWKSYQTQTFLDKSYEELEDAEIPNELSETASWKMESSLPSSQTLPKDDGRPVVIYTTYNLDPHWLSDVDAHRIFLWEPSHFAQYPVANTVVNHFLEAAKNLDQHSVYVGEFEELKSHFSGDIHFKRHPFSKHFRGISHEFDRLHSSAKNHRSFFSFWKEAQPHIRSLWK
ncbi:MAG: hypothetical protein SchgKO_15540 [Schleiferiaceae bacterium]